MTVEPVDDPLMPIKPSIMRITLPKCTTQCGEIA